MFFHFIKWTNYHLKVILVSSTSQMNWLLTVPIASLYSDGCMPKTNRHVTHMQKKEYFLGHNLLMFTYYG